MTIYPHDIPENDTQWLTEFAELARRSKLQRLPATTHAQLLQAFKQYKTANKPPTFWQRLAAALTFDSTQMLLPVGARTTRLTEGRQLVYETAQGDIALDIQPTTQAISISGQLFVKNSEYPLLIQLLQDDQEITSTICDELGEFNLKNLTSGNYQLLASSQTYELLIDALVLG